MSRTSTDLRALTATVGSVNLGGYAFDVPHSLTATVTTGGGGAAVQLADGAGNAFICKPGVHTAYIKLITSDGVSGLFGQSFAVSYVAGAFAIAGVSPTVSPTYQGTTWTVDINTATGALQINPAAAPATLDTTVTVVVRHE